MNERRKRMEKSNEYQDDIIKSALNLIECVEKYLVQEATRSTLVAAKDNLKKLIK